MSEQPNETERNNPEEPAEGAVAPGGPTKEREHTQDPAEGPETDEPEER